MYKIQVHSYAFKMLQKDFMFSHVPDLDYPVLTLDRSARSLYQTCILATLTYSPKALSLVGSSPVLPTEQLYLKLKSDPKNGMPQTRDLLEKLINDYYKDKLYRMIRHYEHERGMTERQAMFHVLDLYNIAETEYSFESVAKELFRSRRKRLGEIAQRGYSANIKQKSLELLQEGYPPWEVCKIVGISKAALYSFHKGTIKTSRNRYARKFILMVLKEMEQGLSSKKASEKYNLHPSTLSRWKVKFGFYPTGSRPKKERLEA